MKKFISTLTSLAMSASLTAGALAVPFAGSALTYDKTYKTLTIESEKTTISASEIAAGDVTVKCDVYFEETPDTDGLSDTASITAMMTCEGDTVKMDSIDKLFADREQYNYTIQNGEKKGTIVGKGVINNRVTNYLMKMLEEKGIPTHFVEQLSDRETAVKAVRIVPLEVIVRNVAAG